MVFYTTTFQSLVIHYYLYSIELSSFQFYIFYNYVNIDFI